MISQLSCTVAVPQFVDIAPCATLIATQGTGKLSAQFPRSLAETFPFHPALCSVAKSVYLAKEEGTALNLSRLFPRGFSSERRFSRDREECLVVLYQVVVQDEHIHLSLRYRGGDTWYVDGDSTLSVSEDLFCERSKAGVRVFGQGEVTVTYANRETCTLAFTSTYSDEEAFVSERSALATLSCFQQRRVTDIVCRRTEELFLCDYQSSIYCSQTFPSLLRTFKQETGRGVVPSFPI
jgi:hypothetical protein